MKFTKMQGIGNDYVYVNCFEEKVEDPSALAIQVSDRHFGIGSDGLILICPSEVADCEMAMYNADGSRGEMCGNGVRCVGKDVYKRQQKFQSKISCKYYTTDSDFMHRIVKRKYRQSWNNAYEILRIEGKGSCEYLQWQVPWRCSRSADKCMLRCDRSIDCSGTGKVLWILWNG